MANESTWEYMKELYHFCLEKDADPRTANFPLVSSPVPTIVITFMYIIFVKYLGPAFMKNREPYKLKTVLIYYNALQTVASGLLFYECVVCGYMLSFSFFCQPFDRSVTPLTLRVADNYWWYFAMKFLDMFDTIFFVLTKKNSHITLLHVFHHSFMPLGVWYGVKFGPGGHSMFLGLANSFVHTVMYTYYLLAALGPKYRKYLWWKKHLTIVQLVQFFVGTIHAGQLFFIECDTPQWYALFSIIIGPTFFLMFYEFYTKEYGRGKKIMRKEEKEINGNVIKREKVE